MQTTSLDTNRRSFIEGAASLDGKEGQLVTLHTDGTVILATAGNAMGVYEGKLQAGMKAVTVRMLGKNGTVRMIQKAAINPGAAVMQDPANATKVIAFAQATGMRRLGYKVSPATTGADGDIIEVVDCPEAVLTKDTVAAPTTLAATITALTFTAGGATGPEVEALRDECAKLATDLKALRDKVVASGLLAQGA